MKPFCLLAFVAIISTTVSASNFLAGTSLKLNDIYETTNWDLLEDLYLYHNAIRNFHEAPSLRFNHTLMDYARLKALIYAWYDGEVPAENGDITFGENVHWSPLSNKDVTAFDVIDDWYFGEEERYDYDAPLLTGDNRHFTQMVWKATKRFGCGQAVSKGTRGGTYTVCYYDPPGNVFGEEKDNVSKPNWNGDGTDAEEAQTEEPAATTGDGQSETQPQTDPQPQPQPDSQTKITLIKEYVANTQAHTGQGFFTSF